MYAYSALAGGFFSVKDADVLRRGWLWREEGGWDLGTLSTWGKYVYNEIYIYILDRRYSRHYPNGKPLPTKHIIYRKLRYIGLSMGDVQLKLERYLRRCYHRTYIAAFITFFRSVPYHQNRPKPLERSVLCKPYIHTYPHPQVISFLPQKSRWLMLCIYTK